MIKAGLKKEFQHISRTGRFVGIIIAIVIFAFVDPLLLRATQELIGAMGDMLPTASVSSDSVTPPDATFDPSDTTTIGASDNVEMGGASDAVGDASDLLGDTSDMLGSMFSDNPAVGVASAQADITGTGVLIVLLVLMAVAGGEQKKRSTIIPHCAGLKANMYIAPKFILYPSLMFCLSFVATLIAGGMSILLFGGSLDFGTLLLSGVIFGVFMAFVSVLQLTVGICTGKPGVTVIILMISVSLVPVILSSFRIDKFNPFALTAMAQNAVLSTSDLIWTVIEPVDFAVSFGLTIVLSVILYFVTLFVLNAREIKNEGNEPVL